MMSCGRWAWLLAGLVLLAGGCGRDARARQAGGLQPLQAEVSVVVDELGDHATASIGFRNDDVVTRHVEVASVSCGCISPEQRRISIDPGQQASLSFRVQPVTLAPKKHTVRTVCSETAQSFDVVVVAGVAQGMQLSPDFFDVVKPIRAGAIADVAKLRVALPEAVGVPEIVGNVSPSDGSFEVVVEAPREVRRTGEVITYECDVCLAARKVVRKRYYELTVECRAEPRYYQGSMSVAIGVAESGR